VNQITSLHTFLHGISLDVNIPAATLVENGNENEDMTDDVVLQQCRNFISTVQGKSSKCNNHAMHS
jgi:hypothetical protein